MSISGRRLSIGALAVLALVCLAVVVYRSGGNSKLSRYRAELRAHGEKLTVAEIAILPSTNPAEIAARQVIDQNSFIANPTLIANMMQFTAPGKARVAWRGELSIVPWGGGQPMSRPGRGKISSGKRRCARRR